MIEIYIKPALTWLKMDLDEGTQFALTFQLANIGDASIYANRSNNISFPKTAQNLLHIQNAQIPNSIGVIQYAKTEAKYIQDGIDLLQDCYFIVNSIKATIEATLYSGNYDLISILAEKKLNVDADYGTESLTGYEYPWTTTVVDAKRAETSGVKYPLIDWFSDSPWEDTEYYMSEKTRAMWVKYYQPAIFLKDLIDKIITGHGFTYGSSTSPVLLNDLYLKSLIPCTTHITIVDVTTGTADIINPQLAQVPGEYPIIFDALTGFFFSPAITGDIYSSTVDGQLHITIDSHVEVNNPAPTGATSVGFKIYNSLGEEMWYGSNIVFSGGGTITVNPKFDFLLDIGDLEIFYFKFVVVDVNFPGNGKILDMSVITITPAGSRIGIGYDYPIANNLPEITQIDLIKWFMQMFGCFIKQTKDRTIWFKTLDEFITDCGSPNNALDWSDKFAPDEEPEINFVTELGQKNYFMYADDDPMSGTKYNSYIAIDDQTIQPENNYVQSPFAASEYNLRMKGLRFPSIKAITDFDWSGSTQPRILIDNTSTPSGATLTVNDGFSTTTIATNFPLCYFVNPTIGDPDLTMQSLIAENYVGFSSVFNHPKIIKQRFWLSIMDIYNLDQFIPIYCKQLGGYYIVMKVVNWVKDEPTECELLKIQ